MPHALPPPAEIAPRGPWRRSFAARLTAWLLVVAVLPLLMLAGITSRMLDQTMQRSVEAEVVALRNTASQAARQLLLAYEDEALIFAAAPALRAADPRAQEALLRDVVEFQSAFQWLGVFDLDGRLVVSSDGRAGRRLRSRPAVEAGTPQPHVIEGTVWGDSRPVITYLLPVKAFDGRIRGVLAAEVDLARLIATGQAGRFRASGETYLVRGDGHFVTPPRFILPHLDSQTVDSEGFRRARQGQSGIATYPDYRGVPVIGAYAPFPLGGRIAEAPHWVILSEVNVAEARAPFHSLRRQSALVLGAVALLVAAFAYLVSRQITVPLRRLGRAADRIAQGHWQERVPSQPPDEFRRLGEAFNQMAVQVESVVTDLQRSNAALEAAEQLRNRFINAITHDLRTPLNSIVGFTELLRDNGEGHLSPTQAEFLSQIAIGSTRLARLIDDMLDVARLEAGTFQLTRSPTDLAHCMQAVVQAMQPQVKAAGIELEVDLPERTEPILADADRIERVVGNLLSNALKFTPRGGTVRVRGRLEGTDFEGAISDTGPGIAPEDLPKLFQRFSQLEVGRTSGRGSGLGLSICKEIVEAHGGAIGVESTPGRGSTFWFRIPRRYG